MGRKKIEVPKEKLVNVIEYLEKENRYTSHTELWKEVAEYFKTSVSIIIARVREYGLSVKTPVSSIRVKSGSVRRKKRIPEDKKETYKKLFNESVHGAIEKASNGSLSSAIKLKCLDCSAGQKKEVTKCPVTLCPLWHFRPYQEKSCGVSSIQDSLADS